MLQRAFVRADGVRPRNRTQALVSGGSNRGQRTDEMNTQMTYKARHGATKEQRWSVSSRSFVDQDIAPVFAIHIFKIVIALQPTLVVKIAPSFNAPDFLLYDFNVTY